MKTAIHQAAELYQANGMVLADELTNHLKFGYVFCTPDRLLLAYDAKKEGDEARWVEQGTGDTWYVKLAIGKDCIPWFIKQAPYENKWVAWARGFKAGNDKPKFYDFSKLKHRFNIN